MGWRDDLTVGDFVLVDSGGGWTVEVVTRQTNRHLWVSRRDGGKDRRFTRSWGRCVGEHAVLSGWTAEEQARLEAQEEIARQHRAKEEQRCRLRLKANHLYGTPWQTLPESVLDAVLSLVESAQKEET